jgi:penicillin G amidase
VSLFNGVRREIIPATRHLLDRFDEGLGVGASGVDFFVVPGVEDAKTRRDVIILRSVAKALDQLAGDTYAPVFGRSTNQDDYRWGRLHRVRLPHPLGGPFSTPPAFGAFPAPLGPDLPGISIDGGLYSVDVANYQILGDADPVNAFIVPNIPVQRYVARVRPFGLGFDVESSQAGGQSGIPGTPFYLNLLEPYLANETYRVRQTLPDILGNVSSSETFLPAR